MCGMCGVFGGEGHPQETAVIVHRMMESVAHRGPDGQGIFVDAVCGLGHRRLAILDLSSRGSQPMHSEDGTVSAVVNGEIYNYKQLRSALRAQGHTFHSDSDSEVVVHAYEEHGADFVKRLRGMFALAVYDSRRRRLILARDPSGKKPLYYGWSGSRLLFGSEIKALLAGGMTKEVNYEAVPAYLQYQYVPGDQTLFAGVKKLPAGHCLTVSQGGAHLSRYWSLSDAEQCGREAAPWLLRDKLEESVRLRLQSDVPIGAFLSGGLDSSAVVALWRRVYTGRLHTFTAVFGSGAPSEAKYARQVSKHLGTEYHEVTIDPGMVAENLDRITYHHDEPLGDAAIICNYFLAREAKRYVTVVLAGEGGDELFGGYPWHRYARLATAMSGMTPRALKALVKGAVSRLGAAPSSRWYPLGRMALLPCQDGEMSTLMYSTSATSAATLGWLLKDEHRAASPVAPPPMRHLYNRALAADYLNLLPEKFLMKADKATMAWAVEERLPLLDQEVVRLAFSIPPALKRNKWVLREAVKDLLPRDIVYRRKQGFGTPVAQWLSSPRMKERVAWSLAEGPLVRAICRPSALESLGMVSCASSGGKAALKPYNVIWGLVALQVWHDVWFGK